MAAFQWDEHQRARLLAAPPCSRDALFHRDFGVVRGARLLAEEPARALYATQGYALFWVEMGGDGQVDRVNCLDASDAEPLFWSYYYAYPEAVVKKAQSCFRPGESVSLAFQTFMQNRLAPPAFKVLDAKQGVERRAYVLRHFPPLRAALLHLDVGPDERIKAMRLLVGAEASAQRAQAGRGPEGGSFGPG